MLDQLGDGLALTLQDFRLTQCVDHCFRAVWFLRLDPVLLSNKNANLVVAKEFQARSTGIGSEPKGQKLEPLDLEAGAARPFIQVGPEYGF